MRRSEKSRLETSISAVNKNGWLLVFPMSGRKDPLSIWHVLHPRSVMKWEWSEHGDDRVARLWHLRRLLAESQRVIYSKWYHGRATLISQSLFKIIWVYFRSDREKIVGEGREVMELLEMESPLSTKQIRRASDLTGRENEKRYESAMKELWRTFAIVGVGEIIDGAFPSLAHAATHVFFEELCLEAERELTFDKARLWLDKNISDKSFRKQLGLTTSANLAKSKSKSKLKTEAFCN
jgi:hypothetical protein